MTRVGSMPLLGPGAELVRALSRLPVESLRSEAQKRGVVVPADANAEHIAVELVIHKLRTQSEDGYRDTGVAFDSREDAYPFLRALVVAHGVQKILDVGCGPGLFAEELHRSAALPADGAYIGFDIAPSAIEIATRKFADDARFQFRVGDAESLDRLPRLDIDGVVISFVLSYMSTHSVDRFCDTLARLYPDVTVIVGLTFRSCVDRLDGVEPDEERERDAAHRYLAGDHSAADGIWDVRRLRCYRESLEARYTIVEEQTLPGLPQVLWVAKRTATAGPR